MTPATKHALYPDATTRSALLFERARHVLPGGNSRHSIFFSPYPLYAVRGTGARVTDVDGVERIDFINNYTSLIHGHSHPRIKDAVVDQLGRLTAVGLPTESEICLAELLIERLPSVEQLRFTNSGTEAVMFAIKAARAFTGRPKIAKIEGCYHGSYDFAEISQTATPESWGPAQRPASVPVAAGEPQSVLDEVIILPWNDIAASRALIRKHASSLAAVLIDPMPSRIGMIEIDSGYAAMIREETRSIGALFILDEVLAFRLGYNGAQTRYNITPDITCLAKIIGGGFPVGAVGGSRRSWPCSMAKVESRACSMAAPITPIPSPWWRAWLRFNSWRQRCSRTSSASARNSVPVLQNA